MFTIRRRDTFGEVFFGVQTQDAWDIFSPPWQLKQQPKSPRRKKDKLEPVEGPLSFESAKRRNLSIFLLVLSALFWTIAWNGTLYAKLYNNTNLGRTRREGKGQGL